MAQRAEFIVDGVGMGGAYSGRGRNGWSLKWMGWEWAEFKVDGGGNGSIIVAVAFTQSQILTCNKNRCMLKLSTKT